MEKLDKRCARQRIQQVQTLRGRMSSVCERKRKASELKQLAKVGEWGSSR